MEDLSATCRDLWNDWRKENPNHPLVQQASNIMKSYTKNDWDVMSLEATAIMEKLAACSANNVPVEGEQAKEAFVDLLNHVEKWFFIPNKEYVQRVAFASSFSNNYKSFFNKYEPNLSKYMINLIEEYKNIL